MACRTALRSALLIEAWRPVHLARSSVSASLRTRNGFSTPQLTRQFKTRDVHLAKRTQLSCSHNENQPALSEDEQGPPQEAVLKAISEVSRTEGRVGQTTNVVIGGTVADDSTTEWLDLDQKVNSYPTVRGFTAIGTGGDDFVQAMVVAVESVLQQPVPEGRVKQKLSSGGKYVSVNIGPVQVISSEQVQAVYNAMRRDDRMKYFL
ncbi:putative YbeD-like domain-containing protein [Rosa chinensis]|uniref:Putative YbeD-like domain-containing protein n=1 Tax=Rosa chinensis TaxID=74649 RepID=A0A2P6R0D3_ROSCH|nr:uncharacterized protein LOC112197593 [Rosa chinensis]PRQ39894.1 putative YbeD-like domain-containing protein [Rosa chinensis]